MSGRPAGTLAKTVPNVLDHDCILCIQIVKGGWYYRFFARWIRTSFGKKNTHFWKISNFDPLLGSNWPPSRLNFTKKQWFFCFFSFSFCWKIGKSLILAYQLGPDIRPHVCVKFCQVWTYGIRVMSNNMGYLSYDQRNVQNPYFGCGSGDHLECLIFQLVNML